MRSGHRRVAGRSRATAVKDGNGNVLAGGDDVTVVKDLKVKGSSIPLKRGTMIRGIRLAEDDDEHVEGHSDRSRGLVLKACFLRKAWAAAASPAAACAARAACRGVTWRARAW